MNHDVFTIISFTVACIVGIFVMTFQTQRFVKCKLDLQTERIVAKLDALCAEMNEKTYSLVADKTDSGSELHTSATACSPPQARRSR